MVAGVSMRALHCLVVLIALAGCDDTNTVPSCGALSKACCASNRCTGFGLVCDTNQHKCVPCGDSGQPCCDGNICTAGGTGCLMGTCQPCGDLGMACCPSRGMAGSCRPPYGCDSGSNMCAMLPPDAGMDAQSD